MLPQQEHLGTFLEELLQKQGEMLGACLINWLLSLMQRLCPLVLLLPPEGPSGADLQMQFRNAG